MVLKSGNIKIYLMFPILDLTAINSHQVEHWINTFNIDSIWVPKKPLFRYFTKDKLDNGLQARIFRRFQPLGAPPKYTVSAMSTFGPQITLSAPGVGTKTFSRFSWFSRFRIFFNFWFSSFSRYRVFLNFTFSFPFLLKRENRENASHFPFSFRLVFKVFLSKVGAIISYV